MERRASVPLYEGMEEKVLQLCKSIHNLNRGNIRKATILLTGHVTLNYHLNKYKPDKISKTCPHCLAAEETTNHYIGQCSKWSAQRSAVFNSFYLSISEVVDDYSIFAIMKYINATGRLKPHHRVAILAPGQADSPLHHQFDHTINFTG